MSDDPRVVPLTPGPSATSELGSATALATQDAPFDPLRLCIFATVSLLGWLLGPIALIFFAGLGVVGYAKARRAGLLRSKCLLGDTRIVLLYLAALVVLGGCAVAFGFGPWRLT